MNTEESILCEESGLTKADIKHYSHNYSITPREALSAMREYAKQESIEFANWRLSICDLYVNFEQFAKSKPQYVDGTKFKTTEQLYQIFLKEKSMSKQ